jgi:hypothetical protein
MTWIYWTWRWISMFTKDKHKTLYCPVHSRPYFATLNFNTLLSYGPMFQHFIWYSDYATGWMTGVTVLIGADIYFLRHRFQTGSWAHPASCLMGTGSLFAGGKAASSWSWQFSSSVTGAQSPCRYSSIFTHVLMMRCFLSTGIRLRGLVLCLT